MNPRQFMFMNITVWLDTSVHPSQSKTWSYLSTPPPDSLPHLSDWCLITVAETEKFLSPWKASWHLPHCRKNDNYKADRMEGYQVCVGGGGMNTQIRYLRGAGGPSGLGKTSGAFSPPSCSRCSAKSPTVGQTTWKTACLFTSTDPARTRGVYVTRHTDLPWPDAEWGAELKSASSREPLLTHSISRSPLSDCDAFTAMHYCEAHLPLGIPGSSLHPSSASRNRRAAHMSACPLNVWHQSAA